MSSYFIQQSARLTFRKLTLDDVTSWLEFFDDNPNLKYMGMDLTKPIETLAEEWISAQFPRYEKHGLGHLAVSLKDTGDLIGLAGINPRVIEGKDEFEIGYSIKPKFWRQGYGTEIAKHFKEYGRKNIEVERLISIIDINNEGSAKVARNNGMEILFQSTFYGMDVNIFGINI